MNAIVQVRHTKAGWPLPGHEMAQKYINLVSWCREEYERPWETDPKAGDRATQFATQSMLISGFRKEKFEAPGTRDHELFLLHRTLASTFLTDAYQKSLILRPEILNSEIRNLHGQFEFREGFQVGTENDLPKGQYSEQLVKEWYEVMHVGILLVRHLDERVRSAFAWAMHDALICIKPFASGNGRTARLMLLDVRRRCGLQPILIRNSHGVLHGKRIQFFRENIFLPYMLTQRFVVN